MPASNITTMTETDNKMWLTPVPGQNNAVVLRFIFNLKLLMRALRNDSFNFDMAYTCLL